jgi:hypothetical protein
MLFKRESTEIHDSTLPFECTRINITASPSLALGPLGPLLVLLTLILLIYSTARRLLAHLLIRPSARRDLPLCDFKRPHKSQRRTKSLVCCAHLHPRAHSYSSHIQQVRPPYACSAPTRRCTPTYESTKVSTLITSRTRSLHRFAPWLIDRIERRSEHCSLGIPRRALTIPSSALPS